MPTAFYLAARAAVVAAGYAEEITQQQQANGEGLTREDVLREAAWVILNSGFRESVIRRIFTEFSQCFLDWRSVHEIVHASRRCREQALHIFGSERKIDAILLFAAFLSECTISDLLSQARQNPILAFSPHQMFGPATSLHLAKNLGLDVAKPDRHLIRLADTLGFDCAQSLCERISDATGDPVRVVDLVLWRYAVIRSALSKRRDNVVPLAA